QDASATSKTNVNLTVGTHTLKLIGRETGLKLDRVILTTDTTCVPVGTGDSCVTTAKTGDLNGDGKVNIFDASILFNNWNSTTTPAYDLSHNGKVDIFDASILFNNWTG
ncbi:MAG: dockerin type I domain-containing protein, partial [Candidatus Saccharibacteria bacterium]|nr:dockerin type I domain-containing protein [Candidatus Saccharibacteria bacterium]